MRLLTLVGFSFALCTAAIGARADGADELAACTRDGNRGQHQEAVDHCSRAINAGDLSVDDLITAYTNRAIGFRSLRRFEDAINDCQKALSMRADDIDAHIACANAYGGKGDYATGIHHFDAVLARHPDDAETHNNRGNLLNQAGDHVQALAEFETALRLDPDFALAQLNRGVVLFNLGRFEESVKALEHAFETAPDNPYALLWLTLAQRRAEADVAPAAMMSSAKEIDRTAWPWPIVAYFSGQPIDFGTALRSATGNDDADQQVEASGTSDQDCEASFYYGEMALILNHAAEATQRLQHAADTCPKTFIEHSGAIAELARK